jgi:hypothetical protein
MDGGMISMTRLFRRCLAPLQVWPRAFIAGRSRKDMIVGNPCSNPAPMAGCVVKILVNADELSNEGELAAEQPNPVKLFIFLILF